MSDGVQTTLIMTVKPEFADDFSKTFAAMVPASRAFAGCRSISGYRNMVDRTQFIIIGDWDSKEAYETYLAWRRDNAQASPGESPMTGPPKVDFWSLLDG